MLKRIERRLRTQYTRMRYRLGLPVIDPGESAVSPEFRHPIDVRRRESIIARYRELFPDAVRTEVQEAERLLAHRFDFLSHPMQHGERIAWSRDPVSGRDWDRGFSPDIPYRGPARLGDVKLPWELSKHQYFFTLGKASWLTGDARYAQEIVRQIAHWIDDNHCLSGVHWLSPLETGTRAVSWILAYPFFAKYCDETLHRRLIGSIAQHMLFAEKNLSTGKYANNHLIADAAILVAGGLFVRGAHSERWLQTGLQHLETEIVRQVRSDGVHAEQSVGYHRYILDQYYLTNALLEANGRSLSATARGALERMTDFLMDVVFPDGTPPSFGDCDDARGIWCRADCIGDFRAALTIGATLFGRSDFKAIAGGPSEDLLWLCGEQGLQRFLELPSNAPDHASRAYRDAGYYVMRSGWTPSDSMLVFDCGPLGYGTAGHGHADALSFQLHTNGFTFLTDPGTYSYNLDYRLRDAFRATRAHNTVLVDGSEQSQPADRMSWSTQAVARCNRWITTPAFDLVDGEHYGYARLAAPVIHRRVVIFLKPDTWIVCDRLAPPAATQGAATADAAHDVQMFLHLPPDCSVALDPQTRSALLQSTNGARLRVSQVAQLPRDCDGLMWEEVDDWHSAHYGAKVPTKTLRISGRMPTPAAWVTCLTTDAGTIVRASAHEADGVLLHVERASGDGQAGGATEVARIAIQPGTDTFVEVLHPLQVHQ